MYRIKNHIREELRQGSDYLLALNDLVKMLELEKDLDIYCAHEAGHVAHFLRAGGKESEFVYCGPTIYFDPVPGKFRSYPCGVGKPRKIIQTAADLESFARISVAGGVFEKELEGSSNPGDKDDRYKFHTAYAVALVDGIIPTHTEQDMWLRAQEEVGLELATESGAIQAGRIAKNIKVKCFQVNYYSDSSDILFL
jgi:hypothetical protein